MGLLRGRIGRFCLDLGLMGWFASGSGLIYTLFCF
jgi:hypothetical protein